MAVLGAEQIQDSKLTSRYFDKYMLAVNIGGIIATVAFLFSSKSQNTEEDRYLFQCIVAISVLFIAAVLFIIGYRYYIDVNLQETVVTSCIPVVINAYQSRHKYQQNTSSDDEPTRIHDHHPSTFLDFAKLPTGKFHDRIVNDVKSLQGVIIVFTLLIPYWLIYNQVKLLNIQ
jgi:hypothetical protein